MKLTEAQASLLRWQRWAAGVADRWPPGSPMAILAQRRVLEAQLRVMEREQSQWGSGGTGAERG